MILADDVPMSIHFGQALGVDQAFAFMRGERPETRRNYLKQRRRTQVLTPSRRFMSSIYGSGVFAIDRFMS